MRSALEKPARCSMRWNGYDYAQGGAYFVTICSQERCHAFGRVLDGAVDPSPYGEITNEVWQALPRHFPYVELDAWQIMPNHVHGIVIISHPIVGAGFPRPMPSLLTDANNLGQGAGGETPPLRGLSHVIGYFKYQTTKRVNIQRQTQKWPPVKVWQRGYYDRVIRNERELRQTQRYIFENPQNWDNDENNV